VSVKIAGIEFHRVVYDAPVDVLYLHVGDPVEDRDWDETAEGDGVSYLADGSVGGFTILNTRWRLEREGELAFTLPEQEVRVSEIDAAHIIIAGLEFERNSYDVDRDALSVQREGFATSRRGESKEVAEVRFGRDGAIVGMTIRDARRRYAPDRMLTITLPRHRVVATDFAEALAMSA
jgi:uncharacterized protein YuzE